MKRSCFGIIFFLAFCMFFSQISLAKTIYPVEDGGLKGFDHLVKGAERYVRLGSSIAVGDFNGDGIMDLAVGSPRSSSPRGIEEAGTVSIFFGGSEFTDLPTIFEAVKDGKESVLLYGSSFYDPVTRRDRGDYVGQYLASGDLNNNGIDDLIIVAQRVDDTGRPTFPDNSKIYIVYGKPTLSGNISLASSADAVIKRNDAMHVENIVVGDVNNNGMDDILITDILTGSTAHPPMVGGRELNGAVYVIYGGGLKENIDPSQDSNATIFRDNGNGILQVYGMTIGDFNGNGLNDIALGASNENSATSSLSKTGNVYLLKGSSSPLSGNIDIDNAADVVISGGLVNDQIGTKLTTGDFNGDGIDDLIIGAPLSGWGQAGTSGKGKVQIVFGSESLKPTMDLYEDSDVNLQLSDGAAKIGFLTGLEVIAEDINGDSVDDLIISSPNAFYEAGTNGWVHIVYGGTTPDKEYKLDLDADIAVIAPESGSQDPLAAGRMGQTMAVADLNNDGNMDLILGAPRGLGNNSFVGSG